MEATESGGLSGAAAKHAAAGGSGEHEAEHGGGGGGGDVTEEILDKVIFGLDARTGKWVYHPYDEGRPIVVNAHVYAPKMYGPVKMEFTKHMAGVLAAGVILFALAMLVARRVLAGLRDNTAPRGPLANAFEAVVVFVRDEIVAPVGGHHLAHYTPLFLTYFMFILIANLIGLIPHAGSATGNFGVTLALGGSIYFLIWLLGVFNQGPLNFILHMVPPGTPWWLWPLMFVLELVGPVIKCFVLCVRLFANMIAGHLIIGAVLNLTTLAGAIGWLMIILGVPMALGVSLLEVLVCFIQAYVFTMLAVVFIGAAVHPEH